MTLWAILLGALLIIVAAWGAGRIAASQERDTLDTRLQADLRSGRAEFADALAEAETRAQTIANSEEIQRALADSDPAAAAAALSAEEDSDNVGLVVDGRLLAGQDDWAASRTVDVLDDQGEVVGSVVAGVPFDHALAMSLGEAADLDDDILVVVENGEVLAASSMFEPGAAAPGGTQGTTDEGGQAYRYVSAPLLEDTGIGLIALTSEAPVEATVKDTQRRAFYAALATVGVGLLLAVIVMLFQRRRAAEAARAAEEADRRRRSRDVRRAAAEDRVREAVALVGEALAATHDPEALLPVILQSAIEATGAAGARLVSGGTEVVRAGHPEEGGGPLTLRLGTDVDGIGRLLLYPPRDGSFDEEAEQLAHWLAAQASIAIENERLHRTVKRQAITDELTQLANRRRFTETLAVEVRRAERFGDPLGLVLADLDDFKLINDQYGHQAGDEVLRRFADVLRENVRDFDLPVRYGGEEFAVLLPETGLDGAEQLARRLQAALRRLRLPTIGGDRAPVTASFGVAAFPSARTADELLSAADGALYRAKAAGKDRVATA